MKETKSAKECD